MTWATFTLVWSESETVRHSFDVAVKLSADHKQPFSLLSSVEAHSLIGVRLERKYLALTEQEVLAKFMLPPDGFGTELKSVSLLSENGEPTVYFLFESGEERMAVLTSERQLLHMDHVLDGKKNQLRKEQPLERFQVCCQQEVNNRRPQATVAAIEKAAAKAKASGAKVPQTSPWSLMTLQEAAAKAANIIAAREAAEADDTAKPSEVNFEAEMEEQFVKLQAVQATTMTPMGPTAKGAAKRPRAKDSAAPKRATKARKEPSMPPPSSPGPPPSSAQLSGNSSVCCFCCCCCRE